MLVSNINPCLIITNCLSSDDIAFQVGIGLGIAAAVMVVVCIIVLFALIYIR